MTKEEIQELALELATQVKDDPYICMGGCSFNRYVERVEDALQKVHSSAKAQDAEAVGKLVGVLENVAQWAGDKVSIVPSVALRHYAKNAQDALLAWKAAKGDSHDL